MTIVSSGQISTRDINVELGVSPTLQISTSRWDVLALLDKERFQGDPLTETSFSDFYGKSWVDTAKIDISSSIYCDDGGAQLYGHSTLPKDIICGTASSATGLVGGVGLLTFEIFANAEDAGIADRFFFTVGGPRDSSFFNGFYMISTDGLSSTRSLGDFWVDSTEFNFIELFGGLITSISLPNAHWAIPSILAMMESPTLVNRSISVYFS
jgi:hypothetical protein